MNMFKLIGLVILLSGAVLSTCPEPSLINPCSCEREGTTISCYGANDLNLVKIFENMEKTLTKSDKHFKLFILRNNYITEMTENTFKDITFDSISIYDCSNLQSIHENAFHGTDKFTTEIQFTKIPYLSTDLIFKILGKFDKIQEISLIDINLNEIPANAFSYNKFHQENLHKISIGGESIKVLQPRSFSSLKNLISISIIKTSIEIIPDYAFEMNQYSNSTLTIMLENLNYFTENSLVNIRRPAVIDLGYVNRRNDDYLHYLDEKVFLPFLKGNHLNQIKISVDFEFCPHCRNYWLLIHKDLLKQLSDKLCDYQDKSIEYFKNCGIDSFTNQCYNLDQDTKTRWIYCNGTTKLDLKGVFQDYSETLEDKGKHFDKFTLNNTSINVLEDNIFNGLTFDEINIESCTNLTSIDKNAFLNTSLVTKILKIQKNPLLTSQDNTIFDLISQFVNLNYLYLDYTNITEIPSNAFKPINGIQDQLKELRFFGSSFEKIGSNAFYNLPNLEEIRFDLADFSTIPAKAFKMRPANTSLIIDFTNCPKTQASAFQAGSLSEINRPTRLLFGDESHKKQITILKEEAFGPFLLENDHNVIELRFQEFDCNDCHNYWLMKHQDKLHKIEFLKCSDGKQFSDQSHFKGCPS